MRLSPLLILTILFAACSQYEAPEFSTKQGAVVEDETPNEDVEAIVDEVEPELEEEVETPEEPEESPIRSSQGTGGPIGMNEVNFTDSNNLTSSYKIMAPDDVATKVYGLHVHFHGDGGGGYRDFPNQATRYGLIGVTVRAPNQNLQWGRAQGVAHAQFSQDLIQNEILKKYNIDLDKIYFSGVSGGAYFLSGSFLPAYGSQYKSGAFLMCGGEAPRTDIQNPEVFKDFRIHWQVTAGERADITNSVQQSVAAYKAVHDQVQGDPTKQTIETTGAGGHCEFFEMAYTPGIQAMVDAKFKVVLPSELADQP
ncbi:hypothetical protein [Pseudobacteriovorax antillogorgiicola]|uniref:Poly(3-hydroxybutyrate) depolymerase n=1 Tax=Pseudobacteriovorax antillogorgiicola TaxID=1513793 RepID=A0A1Y6BNI4_9BACT|nr:hypothetical protein [Pseudobacteriovorax antillogorgiicola]TCS54496.1 hypothetical protein EDD56_1069 [Pseudobacteriovorax antillogorgiicola]SMF19051.1 hypothetical protein SAMN06296036_106234 [Pseudobacteriovorax antillogorgiicola]